MHLEVICDVDRLQQFAPEWRAFATSQPHVRPFQLPEWLITWWVHFGSGRLRVLVCRQQRCVGVLPCFLHQWNGARQITLVGSGISDYLDPVFAVSHTSEIIGCLREYLTRSNDWDVCDWQDLCHDTPLDSLFGDAWTLHKKEEVVASELELAGSFEQYWTARPRHLRRNVRRYSAHARQNGPLEFQMSADANYELMDALMRLHAARWNMRGEPGMIRANGSAEFLREVVQRFAEHDMLRVFSLRYRGEIAAIILAFIYQGTVYGYLEGFDPAYKQFSLATVLLHDTLNECYRRGFRAWDFCRGDENYKGEWGAQAMRRCRVVLQSRRS